MGSDLAELEVEKSENFRVKHSCSKCGSMIFGPTYVQIHEENLVDYHCEGCSSVFRVRHSEFPRFNYALHIVG